MEGKGEKKKHLSHPPERAKGSKVPAKKAKTMTLLRQELFYPSSMPNGAGIAATLAAGG